MFGASAATERPGRGRSPEQPAWDDEGAGEAAPVRATMAAPVRGRLPTTAGRGSLGPKPGDGGGGGAGGGTGRRLPGTVPSLPRRSPRGSASSPVVRALFGPRGNGGVGRQWRERRRRRRPSAPERRRRRPAVAPVFAVPSLRAGAAASAIRERKSASPEQGGARWGPSETPHGTSPLTGPATADGIAPCHVRRAGA